MNAQSKSSALSRSTLEGHREGQRAVKPARLLLYVVGVVADLGAVAVEGLAFALVSLETVEERLQTLVVQAVLFHEVYQIELVRNVLARVGHREEVPLGVLHREEVGVDDQIVFERRSSQRRLHLHCLGEIA